MYSAENTWFRGLGSSLSHGPGHAPVRTTLLHLLWPPVLVPRVMTPSHLASEDTFAHILRWSSSSKPQATETLEGGETRCQVEWEQSPGHGDVLVACHFQSGPAPLRQGLGCPPLPALLQPPDPTARLSAEDQTDPERDGVGDGNGPTCLICPHTGRLAVVPAVSA